MMVPLVFVTWVLGVLFATLAVYVALQVIARSCHVSRGGGRPVAFPVTSLAKLQDGLEQQPAAQRSGGDAEVAASFGHLH